MAKKLPKASPERVEVTQGREPGHVCLYNLTGLSLGKLEMIKRLLSAEAAAFPDGLAEEVVFSMNKLLVGKKEFSFNATIYNHFNGSPHPEQLEHLL